MRGAARAPWFDRNLSVFGALFYDPAAAPAALTVRASYTVPAGRRAYFHTVGSLGRSAVAGAPGIAQVVTRLQGVPGAPVTVAASRTGFNVVSSAVGFNVDQFVCAPPGSTLEVCTEDLSVGGTLYFTASLLAMEFDE